MLSLRKTSISVRVRGNESRNNEFEYNDIGKANILIFSINKLARIITY